MDPAVDVIVKNVDLSKIFPDHFLRFSFLEKTNYLLYYTGAHHGKEKKNHCQR
mgnify:CR=1 FL=1